MKEQRTGKASPKTCTDWKRLRALTDEEIRSGIEADPDAYPTDANFWKNAKVVLPQPKQTVTIRLDADLLGWLRRQKGYQNQDQRRAPNLHGSAQVLRRIFTPESSNTSGKSRL